MIPDDIKKTILTALAYYMGDETTRIRDFTAEQRALTAIEWVATQPSQPKAVQS